MLVIRRGKNQPGQSPESGWNLAGIAEKAAGAAVTPGLSLVPNMVIPNVSVEQMVYVLATTTIDGKTYSMGLASVKRVQELPLTITIRRSVVLRRIFFVRRRWSWTPAPTTTLSAEETAVRPAGTRAKATTGTTRSTTTATARAAFGNHFLGERGQLLLGHHAVVIGVGPIKKTFQARVGDFVPRKLAIVVLIKGHHAGDNGIDGYRVGWFALGRSLR